MVGWTPSLEPPKFLKDDKNISLERLLNLSTQDLADIADRENTGIMSANILGKEKDKLERTSSPCPIRKLRL